MSKVDVVINAARVMEDEIYSVLCASNGITDNEWRTKDGVATPDFPITGWGDSMKALEYKWVTLKKALKEYDNV